MFNALDLMENKQFLEPLKFGIGDGNLQYYLYNWKCPSMEPNQVGAGQSANGMLHFLLLSTSVLQMRVVLLGACLELK